MSDYSDRKLGFHTPNLAYDLPDALVKIHKLIRNAELEGLKTFADNAQVLLNAVTADVEAHLLLLQHRLNKVKEQIHDDARPGGLQHPESAPGRALDE